jgi:hypothetical protein
MGNGEWGMGHWALGIDYSYLPHLPYPPHHPTSPPPHHPTPGAAFLPPVQKIFNEKLPLFKPIDDF